MADMEERDCWFVQPGIVRLSLSGHQWIDVKEELNAGEARKVYSGLVKKMHPGEPTELDPERVGLTLLLAYIVGWSALNRDGRPEPIDESSFDNLTQDRYREVMDAVTAHDAAVAAKREARKNGQDGETPSARTSPSRAAAAGASSGSGS
jgi:hypothetical protein